MLLLCDVTMNKSLRRFDSNKIAHFVSALLLEGDCKMFEYVGFVGVNRWRDVCREKYNTLVQTRVDSKSFWTNPHCLAGSLLKS